MRKIVVLFMLLPLIGMAQVGTKNFIDQNYIEVTGTSESKVEPDEIYITITISEKDKKGRVSVESQEKKMVQRLKAVGIDTEKHLTVQSFGGYYQNYFLRKDDVLKSKQYTLLVKNTEELAKTFNELDKIQVSNAYISRVDHSKMDDLRLEAKIKAIKAAKKKAQAYAEAVGQTAGKALHIRENNFNNYNIRNESLMVTSMAKGAADIGDNDLSFKKITIRASVEAKFELQ